MKWKYGMIKVAEEINLESNEVVEDICELVEIYQDGLGEWTSFCRPSVTCLETLNRLHKDINKDGVNTWFWENGTFAWSMEEKFWDWNSKEEF
jgi:hypothetical protein